MIIAIGIIVVVLSIFGGFKMGHGQLFWLFHPNEVADHRRRRAGLVDHHVPAQGASGHGRGLLNSLKGTPYGRAAYEELLKVLYELFLLGRRNGMIALEEHIYDPANSSILNKYPLFAANKTGLNFFAAASGRSLTARSSRISYGCCWTRRLSGARWTITGR